MASPKKPKKRVEPRFDDAPKRKRSGGLSATEDDRAAPPRKKPAAKRKSSSARKPKKKTSRSRRVRLGLTGLIGGTIYWSFILCIWGGIAVAGVVAWYGAQMPSAVTWEIPDRPPNVKIVAVDGSLIANRGATGGEALGIHEMSPYIPQAVIAIEDKRFYSHFGVDPIGLARAMLTNVTAGRLVQGGSTLTQQLAKNLFLSPDRTVGRKVQEVLLALWLEHEYSKDQILEMYLNRVYFGSGSYGVEAASRRYFDKSARDVTLPEAALLAGLLKAPSRLSPARNPHLAEERSQLVLAAMRDAGHGLRHRDDRRDDPARHARRRLLDRLAALCRRRRHGGASRSRRRNPPGCHRRHHRRSRAAEIRRERHPRPDRRGRQEEGCRAGRAGLHRQHRRGARHGRRLRLRQFPVRPLHRGQAPAGLRLQALRLCHRAGAGPHAAIRAQRRARQDRQMDARKLWRQILRQGHAGDGAVEIAELGRRPADHGGRRRQCRQDGAPHGHRLRPGAQRLAGARHVRGHPDGTDLGLCSLRQWRLPRRSPTSSAASPRSTATCSTNTRPTTWRAPSRPASSA
jgi:hypothetical protein